MKSKEELLKENALLKRINKQLKEQIFQDDFTKYPWLGNLGHWYWDYQANIVDFNPLKAQALGYEMDEIPEHPGFQFFTEKLHKDDYEKIMSQMRAHLKGEIPVWEVKYRIQAKDGSWRLYYDRGKVTQRDSNGKPLFLAGMVFDITEDEEYLTKLIKETKYWQMQAQYDSLTRLYSRFELFKRLEALHQETLRSRQEYFLLMFDIDYFKQINDRYGHLTADKFLNHLGKVIDENLRENDFAGRYGGDEFIIIFTETTKDEVLKIFGTIQKELQKLKTFFGKEITLSGGIASNKEEDDLEELLNLVDTRLYQAKKQGRDQIVYR